MAGLDRYESCGVTLLGDLSRPCGVTFAFTERTGGVSKGQFSSLNLGDACGDDPADVAENRRRLLCAVGAGGLLDRLVNPRQVHGDRIVSVTSASDEAVERSRLEAREGADAVVCTVADVPVLLCFADCVPVVVAQPGGFAVAHSGWRGTIARIAAKATLELSRVTGSDPAASVAYIGPHIAGEDYEVSEELLTRFVDEFGEKVALPGRRLDLACAIGLALADVGVDPQNVVDSRVSTPRSTDRFYSYRAEGGSCGRHGAIALMRGDGSDTGAVTTNVFWEGDHW